MHVLTCRFICKQSSSHWEWANDVAEHCRLQLLTLLTGSVHSRWSATFVKRFFLWWRSWICSRTAVKAYWDPLRRVEDHLIQRGHVLCKGGQELQRRTRVASPLHVSWPTPMSSSWKFEGSIWAFKIDKELSNNAMLIFVIAQVLI